MNFLFKEEPTHYSYDDLVRDGKTSWTGVKNPLAQKHLRSVKKGDRIFYYHTGDEKAVVGIAKAAADAYPGPEGPRREALRGGRRAGQEAAAPRHALRDQGESLLQGLPARPHLAPLGHARLRQGVGRDREDGGPVRPAESSRAERGIPNSIGRVSCRGRDPSSLRSSG